jgi:hypothetical protein
MQIGNYIIRRSKTIKKLLLNSDNPKLMPFIRIMQVYQCRIFGFCFYRSEASYEKLRKEVMSSRKKRAETIQENL